MRGVSMAVSSHHQPSKNAMTAKACFVPGGGEHVEQCGVPKGTDDLTKNDEVTRITMDILSQKYDYLRYKGDKGG